jgi:membrane protease YdiL (CAAX protease family)
MRRKQDWVGLTLVIFYLVFRVVFDSFWRKVSPYYSYAFEVGFVAAAYVAYKKRINPRLPRLQDTAANLVLSVLGGLSVYRLATFAGIGIPFDLADRETLIMLLLVAPVFEELIFRMALWEALKDVFTRPSSVLVLTTALFCIGHLLALWTVPHEFRVFVLYQSLYVALLGLGAGWARLSSGLVTSSILVHFGFNLGFFLGSVL